MALRVGGTGTCLLLLFKVLQPAQGGLLRVHVPLLPVPITCVRLQRQPTITGKRAALHCERHHFSRKKTREKQEKK
eukprot:1834376-Rhodomonas_salina.2